MDSLSNLAVSTTEDVSLAFRGTCLHPSDRGDSSHLLGKTYRRRKVARNSSESQQLRRIASQADKDEIALATLGDCVLLSS